MKELDLDVTNLVENRGSKVFISKEVLLNFLRESYYPFDIALEGLMSQSDIDEWVSVYSIISIEDANLEEGSFEEGWTWVLDEVVAVDKQ